MSLIGRMYPPTKVCIEYKFRVWFNDDRGAEFHRLVVAVNENQAVAQAMSDDRRVGGGPITFKSIEKLNPI